MDEDELLKMEHGLDLLMKKYKQNLREGDGKRYQAAKEAKAAIRKVVLSLAIGSDIKKIRPEITKTGEVYWVTEDSNGNKRRFRSENK